MTFDGKYDGLVDYARGGHECLPWSTELILANTTIDGIHHFPDLSYAKLGQKCRFDPHSEPSIEPLKISES